ncbi:hypothetical protein BY996DRAFT_6600338 [Phakopsora pachyrhizi]|uniref:Uncharacterized protein n=1 Tax=Phakopsora pachyrhizi TaxID=170000 RepID=A0AAV0BWQ2_PHAPC|nr:hypothetical protein BY996DRAFT_6600338 [Phakopsora pachyrhizi]CAH7690574.1 hypothetical protein PPACK8108_LOCUS25962 [Phakopsora pachyrhizi]
MSCQSKVCSSTFTIGQVRRWFPTSLCTKHLRFDPQAEDPAQVNSQDKGGRGLHRKDSNCALWSWAVGLSQDLGGVPYYNTSSRKWAVVEEVISNLIHQIIKADRLGHLDCSGH